MKQITLKGGPLDGEILSCPDKWNKPPRGLTRPIWAEGTSDLIGFAVYLRHDDSWILEFSHMNADLQRPSE